jgi:hypothetical protein
MHVPCNNSKCKSGVHPLTTTAQPNTAQHTNDQCYDMQQEQTIRTRPRFCSEEQSTRVKSSSPVVVLCMRLQTVAVSGGIKGSRGSVSGEDIHVNGIGAAHEAGRTGHMHDVQQHVHTGVSTNAILMFSYDQHCPCLTSPSAKPSPVTCLTMPMCSCCRLLSAEKSLRTRRQLAC